MDKLILLTAGVRLDNLIEVGKSIVYNTPPTADLTWLIVVDKFHAKGYVNGVVRYCKRNHIDFLIEYGGDGKDRTFGGVLYNEPLKKLITKLGGDPWVYVLDDDNYFHPFLWNFFEEGSKSGKRLLWTSLQMDTGKMREANCGSALTKYSWKGQTYGLDLTTPDPSQVIMRSSLIFEEGGFGSGPLYDFEWLTPLAQKHLDEIYWYHDYEGFGQDNCHSYWNGLCTLKDLMDVYARQHNSQCVASHLLVQPFGARNKLIPLTSEELEIILQTLIKFRNGK